MKFVLDTCLISELVGASPDPSVIAWLSEQQEQYLFLSVLTLGELRKGIERLAERRKRTRLTTWIDGDLKLRFAGRLLPVDEDVAERWGLICAQASVQGITVPVLDGLIAATALVHGMTVVTRNLSDMSGTGALLFSPWSA